MTGTLSGLAVLAVSDAPAETTAYVSEAGGQVCGDVFAADAVLVWPGAVDVTEAAIAGDYGMPILTLNALDEVTPYDVAALPAT